MTEAHTSLWSLTRGQRLRYTGTVLALGVSSALMFASPQRVASAALSGTGRVCDRTPPHDDPKCHTHLGH